MTSDPARPGSRAASLARWFAAADMLLAACSASAAVVLFSMAKGQGIAILGALPMLVAAALFLVAHLALRREWSGRWLWQIAGPATVVFFLFGTAVALTFTAVAAFLGRSAPRNGASRDGTA